MVESARWPKLAIASATEKAADRLCGGLSFHKNFTLVLPVAVDIASSSNCVHGTEAVLIAVAAPPAALCAWLSAHDR